MLSLVKVISTDYDKFKKRVIKLLRFGRKDVQTAMEVASPGIDANPIKDMIAVYGPTNEQGKKILLGYFNKNQLAAPGEVRLFSTDSDGNVKFYTWIKNNGTIEFNGSADNLVRYLKLNQALQQQVTKINTELGKIATGIVAGGGSYTPTLLTLDISASKIDEMKTT
ncbi:MAG TPA: hypothetical protein VN922_19630 [Bacteroidia bacterium]|nr:hypothetical protein [Bacteroidia bacterium]